ncbi:hypothetical protein EXE10_21130 [Acinetobacter sp. WCHAc060033]|uniref:hypothetical protein n=1 Tax=Acinetobacter sp. WCHAc060033 TaxID=2518624 RepID=UPI001022B27F|nr:hypothetical protein [Acinetobacter sp. WCHAc060033]RZG71977.1 hypothetical protein EXE10_21130 [Acinetobacter sp. WCHAc060033]
MTLFLLGLIISWVVCHWYTHQSISWECERLGGFYVGRKTYRVIEVVDLDVKPVEVKFEPISDVILEAERK